MDIYWTEKRIMSHDEVTNYINLIFQLVSGHARPQGSIFENGRFTDIFLDIPLIYYQLNLILSKLVPVVYYDDSHLTMYINGIY